MHRSSVRVRSVEDLLYGCLATQHGLGAAGIGRLLETFGSADGVYGADSAEVKAAWPRASAALLASLARGPRRAEWERLEETCARRGIARMGPDDAAFPPPLRALEAPPPLLYACGSWTPADADAVALVGTRNPTAYGREAALALAREAASAGRTVVSGLALGIDAAAHAGALAGGGRTLAVIGCGLDIPYPMENLALRASIEARGAVFSEYPPGTTGWPGNFPQRNRIISGLARAVIVVEAGARSGALHTVDHARRQGRAVYAVPGPIFSAASDGTRRLLRAGVPPLGSIAELEPAGSADAAEPGSPRLEVFMPSRRTRPTPARGSSAPVAATSSTLHEPPAHPLLAAWEGSTEALGLDALAERAAARGLIPPGAGASALLGELLGLELRGLVRKLPGPAYVPGGPHASPRPRSARGAPVGRGGTV